MSLINASSPHLTKSASVSTIMLTVTLATIPACMVQFGLFGWGIVLNLMASIGFALMTEAVCLQLRKRSLSFYLTDNSALLTGVLIALAFPSASPWWVLLIANITAIAMGKHLYGGLGFNPFNPAMLGYVVCLISFPEAMTRWIQPSTLDGAHVPSVITSLRWFLDAAPLDGYSGATPLDVMRTYASDPEQLRAHPILQGRMAGAGWEALNMAYLAGGLYLMARKMIAWHIPVSVLAGLSVWALFFNGINPDYYASATWHLLSGGTMAAAFFYATDPVSAATSKKGRLLYGFLIGSLTYVIRTWGGYPDAFAFSILLMNFASPLIDYFTQPRTYGHHTVKWGPARKKSP